MAFHRCDAGEIDYSDADNGRISCRVCDWGWILTNKGWKRQNLSMSYD